MNLVSPGCGSRVFFFFFNDTATTEIYTLSLHDALPIRVPSGFFKVLDKGGDWELKRRTDGKVAKTIPAAEIWNEIAYAAWACADPGVQYDTTINEWHTCPEDGRINASNPC